MSNGLAFIQMIYSKDDELLDCEYVRQKGFVRGFLKTFYDEVDVARARNFTAPPAQHKRRHHLLDDTLNDFEAFSNPARSLQYAQMEVDEDDDEERSEVTSDAFGMRSLEYKEVRREEDLPAELIPLLDYSSLKAQCDVRHKQMKQIVHDMSSEQDDRREAATETLNR